MKRTLRSTNLIVIRQCRQLCCLFVVGVSLLITTACISRRLCLHIGGMGMQIGDVVPGWCRSARSLIVRDLADCVHNGSLSGYSRGPLATQLYVGNKQ